MPLLNETEKRQIVERARRLAEDEKHYSNLVETGAALLIIRKTLGESWYTKAGRDLLPQDTTPPHDYDFMLKKEPLPAVTSLLRGGRPENLIRVIDFAHFLKRLWSVSNVKSKINEYVKKEKRGGISQELFSKVYFELKTAAFYRDNGFRVEFIPEGKSKTPDLRVFSGSKYAFVECKKKDPQTREDAEIASICNEICVAILNEMKALGANHSVTIDFAKKIGPGDAKPVIAKAKEMIASYRPEASGSVEGTSISVKGNASHDSIITAAEIHRPNLVNVQFFAEGFEVNAPKDALWSANPLKRGIDAPIRNYQSVTILSSYVPHRVATALGSVRDAYAQISASGGPGIIAVELSLGPRTGEWDLRQILASTAESMKGMPLANLVMFVVEEHYEVPEMEMHGLRSRVVGVRNPHPSAPLPKEIEAATANATPRPRGSLLDD